MCRLFFFCLTLCLRTARAQIGAIYGAAELHLLTDRSEELADTWTFVEREVEALKSVANVKSKLPDLSPASLVLSLLASRGR